MVENRNPGMVSIYYSPKTTLNILPLVLMVYATFHKIFEHPYFHRIDKLRRVSPLEIEKQKKNVIRANFKLFHLHFATFFVGNIILSAIF